MPATLDKLKEDKWLTDSRFAFIYSEFFSILSLTYFYCMEKYSLIQGKIDIFTGGWFYGCGNGKETGHGVLSTGC